MAPTSLEPYEQLKDQLIRLCYRMLGSVADAEDVVQDACIRWHKAGQPPLDAPQAWFTRVCTRLCLDRLKSASAQRESYPGPWLPEPLVEPVDRLELDESISFALLLAVQRLTASERAAFLLHDVFGYRFEEIADILQSNAPHCRQLAVRARQHLRNDRPRFETSANDVSRLSEAFFSAIESGDLESLHTVLADEVTLTSDGGGKVLAAGRPICGRDHVERFLLGVTRKRPRDVQYQRREIWFNGAPGVAVLADGRLDSAYHLETDGSVIVSIYVQRNPDKLRALETALNRSEGPPSAR